MHLTLTGPELVRLALNERPMPAAVTALNWEDDTVRAQLDLRKIAAPSRNLKLAALASPVIEVTAHFLDFSLRQQKASFALTGSVRGLPAHRVLNLLTGPLSSVLRRSLEARGLPDVVKLEAGDRKPVIELFLGTALQHLGARTPLHGMRVTGARLAGGQVELQAE